MAYTEDISILTDTVKSSQFGQHSVFLDTFEGTVKQPNRWKYLIEKYDNWLNRSDVAENKIPKKIHQIWLGSNLPKKYRKWTSSWKEKNPEWEYKLWTERDILSLGIANEDAFVNSKSFGVKSDIARYEILHRFGGVYADTDFECIKSFGSLVNSCDFFAGLMFSDEPQISNGLIGSIPAHPLLTMLIGKCAKPIKTMDGMEILCATGPIMFTETIFDFVNLRYHSSVFFPSNYFFPFPNFAVVKEKSDFQIKKKYAQDYSYAIHYWEASWLRPSALIRVIKWLKKYIRIVFGWQKGK